MSKEISINNVIKATLNGIDESMKDYQDWSGGEWLWNAPEYLITVKIAENLAKIKGSKYITLEDNVDYVLNLAGQKNKGAISDKTRANGRSDIVLWWGDGTPRAIIEVKNSVFRLKQIAKDIDRIREVLKKKKKKSTIKFGLIAFYIDRNYKTGEAKKKIEKKIYKIREEILEAYKDLSCDLYSPKKDIYKDDKDAWSSVVFLLKVK